MNILHLINYAGKGGTERYIENLIDNTHGRLANCFLAYNQEGLLVQKALDRGLEVYNIQMNSPFDLKAAKRVAKLCQQEKIDIIHTHYLRENYIALLSKLFNPKIKVIYTNHIILKDTAVTKLFNTFFTLLQSKVIAISNKAREILIENKHAASKIKVIHHGVNINDYEYLAKEKQGEDFIIFCGSRFTAEKGHIFLIKSIAELKNTTNLSFKVVLANDGPMLEQCKVMAGQLGLENYIEFIGFTDKIYELYKKIDIYVNPSEEEALGFANLEVLSYGIPLIATDVGGVSDIINSDTKCGLLVQYGDVSDFAKALNKIMTDADLRKSLSLNAKKAVDTIFSMENMVKKTVALYCEALKQ